MKTFSKLLTILFLPVTLSAWAGGGDDGGWISSGGEMHKDAHNPWFISNTETVYWCLNIDTSQVSVSKVEIGEAMYRSQQFWRRELTQRWKKTTAFPEFTTGQQNFVELDCKDSRVSLRIIFGKNALNETELAHLQNADRFVAVSVRTHYDQVNLRAKGFIFFSADQDVLNLRMPAQLWQNKRVLEYAISHELGHVFGIPHMGSGLMAEHFLEQVANPNLTEYFNRLPMNNFLNPLSQMNACGWQANSSYFQLPKKEKGYWCVSISEQASEGLSYKLQAKHSEEPNNHIQLGEIIINKNDLEIIPFLGEFYPVSFLYVTKEQNVFDPQTLGSGSVLIGPKQADLFYRGVYKPSGNIAGGEEEKPVFVIAQPKYFRVIGLDNIGGKPGFNFAITYSSPINRIFTVHILIPGNSVMVE